MIKKFVTSNSGTISDADDIFQETAITLYQNIQKPDFELKGHIRNYSYTIARNLWLGELRKQKHTSPLTEYETASLQSYETYEDQYPEIDRTKFIKVLFENVTETCKKILEMVYFFKYSMEEVAKEMGYTNAKNAKNQKFKCMNRIKTLFNKGDISIK